MAIAQLASSQATPAEEVNFDPMEYINLEPDDTFQSDPELDAEEQPGGLSDDQQAADEDDEDEYRQRPVTGSQLKESIRVMTYSQRIQRARTMRRLAKRIEMARERAANRRATPEKLQKRSRKRAIEILRSRILKSRQYSDLSVSEKNAVDARLARLPDSMVKRLANKMLPKVRRAETERLQRRHQATRGDRLNESVNDVVDQIAKLNRQRAMVVAAIDHLDHARVSFPNADVKDLAAKIVVAHGLSVVDAEQLMNLHRATINTLPEYDYLDHTADEDHLSVSDHEEHDDLNEAFEAAFSLDPYERQEGTDSLVKIYKAATPGQTSVVEEALDDEQVFIPKAKDQPKRSTMPQIDHEDVDALCKFLKKRGIDVDDETVEDPQQLTPSQGEFNAKKVASIAADIKDKDDQEGRIMISKDDDVIDGHHRWLAHCSLKRPIKVIRIGLPIDKAKEAISSFPAAYNKKINESAVK
jgi:hypothetical protein